MRRTQRAAGTRLRNWARVVLAQGQLRRLRANHALHARLLAGAQVARRRRVQSTCIAALESELLVLPAVARVRGAACAPEAPEQTCIVASAPSPPHRRSFSSC